MYDAFDAFVYHAFVYAAFDAFYDVFEDFVYAAVDRH